MNRRVLMVLMLLAVCVPPSRAALWVSPNHYRTLVTVDMRGVNNRSNSPVSVDIDFAQTLSDQRVTGTFDEDTIEVIGYDSAGKPAVYDASRSGSERYLLPWRIEKYYAVSRVTLHFVVPKSTYTHYAIYFDTKESGLGKPKRYHGLVGDGDNFVQSYGRREINGKRNDCWCDLDGDGKLDLFKGGTEPYIYCYRNVGGGRFVDAGRLTSGGSLLQFPTDLANGSRSVNYVTFVDWDGDGDQDMLVFFVAGGYAGQLVLYENTTPPGGQLTFTHRGQITTKSGGDFWGNTGFCFVDWFNTGKLDMLVGRGMHIELYRNSGTRSNPVYDEKDAAYLYANGAVINLWGACPETADIDGDGDLDLFCASDIGKVYWFENVGSRSNPVFAQGKLIVFHEGGYQDARSRVKVADFDGDGLLDMVLGHTWERTHYGEQDRVFGRMYKNVGTRTKPKFKEVSADEGAPYTERFQMCDAVRQNSVRAVDWNSDGLIDLIAGDTDGFVWYFRNLTGDLYPVFAAGVKLYADGKPLHVNGEEDRWMFSGYARTAICDWNEDGRKDVIVADGGGWLWLYLNRGSDATPALGPGVRVCARSASGESHPIDGTARGSVLVCDWDNDGKKDVIFAMSGEGNPSEYHDWPGRGNADRGMDAGFLFYRNIGTNANPVLAYPEWIASGDPGSETKPITYTRPNLGAFVDWNGDGVKDFIASEFEHNVRVYFNTTDGAPGVKPQFTSSGYGVKIVLPSSSQMISGADAVDFNRDGDIDILTGQGHGASGLRFWERDYINDFVNSTYPTATVGASERGRLPGEKTQAQQ